MSVFLDFDTFEKRYNQDQEGLVWISCSADLYTPVSVYKRLCYQGMYSFLFESVEQGNNRGRYSIIGLDPDLIWKCYGDTTRIYDQNKSVVEEQSNNPLFYLRKLIQDNHFKVWDYPLPSSAVGLFGFFGYDMIRQLESSLPLPHPDPLELPDAVLIRPTVTIIFDNVYDTLYIVSPTPYSVTTSAKKAYEEALDRVKKIQTLITSLQDQTSLPLELGEAIERQTSRVTHHMSAQEYKKGVEIAKEYIQAGDIFQVVPSQRFSMPFKADPFEFYRSLRRINPSPYLFYMNFDDFCLAGSSPEILVRLQKNIVTIRPIAGTRPRGKTAEEDLILQQNLLADQKECSEHLMLLDLGRNDVGRVCKLGTVHVTEEFTVERYSHVMHIVSEVQGYLKEGYDAVDALLAGLPAGTVSGAPKIRAMEIIHELEPLKRSFYAGGVGYFAANGDMDTCITLRTACIKEDHLYFQAGAGVVADSNPEAEYQETINKAKALQKAAEVVIQARGGGE